MLVPRSTPPQLRDELAHGHMATLWPRMQVQDMTGDICLRSSYGMMNAFRIQEQPAIGVGASYMVVDTTMVTSYHGYLGHWLALQLYLQPIDPSGKVNWICIGALKRSIAVLGYRIDTSQPK